MAPTLEGVIGAALDSPPPLGDRCACGNIFMNDALFCRKCGCKRGVQDVEDNVNQVNRWDLFLEINQGTIASKAEDEPRTLEIAYSPGGQVCHEIVYEDPTEIEKRPRLLVSLQSVLALKALCEREFERVDIITEVLRKCRIAYYKELCYLREQLYRMGSPQPLVDHFYNFEVYWFDPPEYIDYDFKVFLQECIRITNKKLIEENYDLIQKLKALGASTGANSDDDHLKRMLRTMGPGTTLRKMWGFLTTPEYGSEQKREDFVIAARDILKKCGKSDNEASEKAAMEAALAKLRKENEQLQKVAQEAEAFKKRISELEKEITMAAGRGGQQAAVEAARADAEKKRADEAQAKFASLEDEMNKLKKAMKDKESMMKGSVNKLSQRIDQAVQKLDASAKPRGPSGDSPLGPIESSVSALEGCMVNVLAKMGTGSGELEFSEKEAKYKLDIERLQREAKRLKEERDAEALAAAQANARARSAGGSEDLSSLRDQLSKAQEEIARLKAELEAKDKDYHTKTKLLESQLREAEDKCKKMNKGVSNEALEESERALAAISEKYERAQMKISDLKDEIKRLKALCGETADDDSDSSDSNYDGEMPMFLMSYVKRTKSLLKPRWKHLSDDAKFAAQKRDFLFAQKHSNTRESLGEQAEEAFSFLRHKEARRSSAQSQKSRDRLLPARSKTISFEDNNDPVTKALHAQRSSSAEFLQDPEVLKSASNSTGHPLDKFQRMSSGFKQSPALEAAVGISAAELGRPGTSSKPGTADEKRPNRSSTATSISEDHFPPPSETRQVITEDRSTQVEPMEKSTHDVYTSMLDITGQERLGSAGSINRGRAMTPTQRDVPTTHFPPPLMITASGQPAYDPITGMAPLSATLRAYDRSRIQDIERCGSAGSQKTSGSPPAGRRTTFTQFPDSPTEAPIRGRSRAPPRTGSRPESKGSTQSPNSPGFRSSGLRSSGSSLATRGPQYSAPAQVQAEARSSLATLGPQDAASQFQAEARSNRSPPRNRQSVSRMQQAVQGGTYASSPVLQHASVEGRGLSVPEPLLQSATVEGRGLAVPEKGSSNHDANVQTSGELSARRIEAQVQASLGEQSARKRDASLREQSARKHDPIVQSSESSKQRDVFEALESHTLASLLSPSKSRSNQPARKEIIKEDNFLQELSTSSVGSTALPAELSVSSTFSSSPSLPPKRAPQKLTKSSGTRSLPACTTPPAGLVGRSAGFPTINSPNNLDIDSGAAHFSPPLGQGSPLARGNQEKLMNSTFPSPSRSSPKAFKQRRVATAGDLPQPPRETTWGGHRGTIGSLPFTNVTSPHSTMSTTCSSVSPTKSKVRPNTGTEDVSNKSHLPLLMPDFKPGRVHKGPLGMSSTLYVASV